MTNTQRLSRIQRLVTIRERHRDTAQQQLADAARQAEAARLRHRAAAQQWLDQAEFVAGSQGSSISEFAEQRMHLNALRRRQMLAEQAREQKQEQEDECREEAVESHRELRKMELWSDSVEDEIRVETTRQDQKNTDELAAQMHRRAKR